MRNYSIISYYFILVILVPKLLFCNGYLHALFVILKRQIKYKNIRLY